MMQTIELEREHAVRGATEHEGTPAPALMEADVTPQFAPLPGESSYEAQNAPLAPAASAAAALLSGSSWGGVGADGRTVITYSFGNAWSVYGGESASFQGTLTEFSAADRALTRSLLDSISAVCNVTFVEVADSGAQGGQVRYAYSQSPNAMGYAGFAYWPSAGDSAGDVWIGTAQASSQWDFYRPGLILHETLHAIGLKHPFEGGVTLDAQTDLVVNTVMSYSPMAGTRSGSLSKYPAEPMALDVVALQMLYGAAQHENGNTVYDLSQYSSALRTLWDSGGWDTLDASRIGEAVTLDLREGGRSDIGGGIAANAYYGTGASRTMQTTTYTDTLTLSAGTSIEAAVGTSWDDVFIAGAATRAINGSGGLDTVVFTSTYSNYDIAFASGAYNVMLLSTHATATLSGVERIEFTDTHLQALSSLAFNPDAFYAEAYRLYRAALDRDPDQGGLIYQTRALQSGVSLPQLASNFMASPEFQSRFNVQANVDFVTLLYNNVLDRAPDAQGLAYHVGMLDSGIATRADVLVGFSESPENQLNVQASLTGLGAAGMLVPV